MVKRIASLACVTAKAGSPEFMRQPPRKAGANAWLGRQALASRQAGGRWFEPGIGHQAKRSSVARNPQADSPSYARPAPNMRRSLSRGPFRQCKRNLPLNIEGELKGHHA